MSHTPVLKKEVMEYLAPARDENFIDATIGSGGYAFEILASSAPNGLVLGIDIDEQAISELKERIEKSDLERRLILANDNFANISEIVKKKDFKNIKGIVADLGLSAMALEKRGKGFSFLRDEPLIMRFDGHKDSLTAKKIVNDWPTEEIEKILKNYGEERFWRQITKEIIATRYHGPILSTFDLVRIIKKATPDWYQRKRIHPATKTFQALRIAVNNELENLKKFLDEALKCLDGGGRLIVISYHSLEDRIVKKSLKEKSNQNLIKIITKKVIRPSLEEVRINPRSRSAKLRAAVKS